jgi:MoaA/NifB/PqqE/SkfB family radical SAM enzyme
MNLFLKNRLSLSRAFNSFINSTFNHLLEKSWSLSKNLPLIEFVQIQTHSHCNANCMFCPHDVSWHAKNPGTMSDEIFEKILKNLLPFSFGINKGKVCPYLMAEPLIDRKIFERIKKIYKYFPNTSIEIATNGLLLSNKNVEGLIEVLSGHRHEICISHHGIDSYSLDKIMSIDYDKAVYNIVNLIRRSCGRLNILIRGLGASFDANLCYFTQDQYHSHWDNIFERERLNTANVFVEFSKFIKRAGENERIIRKIDKDNPFHCDRINRWVHFMYDGTIRICCMDYLGEVALPNIKNISLIDYFKSDDYKNLVEMVEGKIESPDNFICKRCINFFI